MNNKPTTAAQYAYDAMGLRIGKYDAAAFEVAFYYYNDQWQILAEYDGTAFGKSYVYGNTIDEVLMAGGGAGDLYYAHDHLYSPAALLDDTGAVVERCEYDAYGRVQFLSPNYELRTTSLYANAYTFTGRQLDILDNGNLHHMHYRHRDYSPQLGRFFQQDPLGIVPGDITGNEFEILTQNFDSINLYEYTRSLPTFSNDPYGLKCWTYSTTLVELFGTKTREYTKWYLTFSPVPSPIPGPSLYKRGWRDVQPAREYELKITICITICPPSYSKSETKTYTGKIMMIILDFGWEFKVSFKDPNPEGPIWPPAPKI